MFARHDAREFSPSGTPIRIGPARRHRYAPRLSLAPGEMLFQDSDPRRNIYRVESGAVCHYIRRSDTDHEVITFAFPGDFVGFGDLPTHLSSCQAVTPTVVSVVHERDFERDVADDPRLALRVASVNDREFDLLKSRTVASGRNDSRARLAAYLLFVAGNGSCSGATVHSDDVIGSFVAESLKMTEEDIRSALDAFENQGLLKPTPRGWEVCDQAGLDRVAAAA